MMRCKLALPLFLLVAAATASAAEQPCLVSFTSAAILEPTENTVDSPGVTATSPLSFAVNPQNIPTCGAWTVIADSSWIGFLATSGPAGTGQVSYTVAPNTGGPRTAIITVNWADATGGPETSTYTVNQLGVVPASGGPLAVQYRLDLSYSAAGCDPQASPQPFACATKTGSGPYVLNLPPGRYTIQAVTFHLPNTQTSPFASFVFVGVQNGYEDWQEIQNGGTVQLDVPAGIPLYLYVINGLGSATDTSSLDPNNFADVSIGFTGLTCSTPYGPTLVGLPFSNTCSPSGGTPPWTLSDAFVAPVDGVSGSVVQNTSVTFAGTPTNAAVGEYSFSATAVDSALESPNTSVIPFSGTIPPPSTNVQIGCTPNYGPTSPGAPYTAICSAIGGVPPYTWSAPNLPAGLTLAPNGTSATVSGAFTGTGFEGQTISYAVQVTDSTPVTPETAQYSFTTRFSAAAQGSAVLIGCSPANGPLEVNIPFTQRCSAFGSTPPYFWQLALSTSLPAGITLTKISDFDAIVSGLPAATNANSPYSYSIQASDSDDDFPNDSGIISGTIASQVTFVCSNTAGPTQVGVAYTNSSCGANNGVSPYIYWISAGALPAGITLNPTTGAISGTPITAGAYTFTPAVYDSAHGVAVSASPISGSVLPPVPVLTSSTPASGVAGTAVSLTLTGSGFVTPTVVNFNGTQLTPANVTAATLTVTVPGSSISLAGSYPVHVTTAGGTSNNVLFPVAPALSAVSPNTAVAGAPALSITVTGAGFVSESATFVNWKGTPLSTVFVTPTQLTATIPATDLLSATTANITVSSAGQVSAPLPFTVNPPPFITTINPTSAVAGGSPLTLTVNGTGFAAGAVVQLGQTALTTTFVSPIQLTAAVPAALLTTTRDYSVTVLLGGVTSNAVQFVVGPAPLLTSLTPGTSTAGSGPITLMIAGSGFNSASTVSWTTASGATSLSPSTVTTSQVTVQVSADLLAGAGTAQVTVITDGVPSNALPFTVTSAPVITSLSPASVANGSPGFTLTVNGGGYGSDAVVQWNGAALTTTFVSASQLTAAVPADLLTAPDVVTVTVISGGVTTAPVNFKITATPTIGLPTTITPDHPATVGVSIAKPASVDLNGSLQLSFTPGVEGLPANYMDKNLQFSCMGVTCSAGNTILGFTIPAGQTTVSPVPGSTIMPGTVAGTITVTVATLKRTDTQADVAPATPVTAAVELPKMIPLTVSGTVKITGLSSSGFNVELDGSSNTRELSSITVTFMPAPGTRINGSNSFTIPVSSAFAGWFNSTAGQDNGSNFGLTIPFTLSGDVKVINSVTVTLTNSVGTSTAENGTIAQ